MKIIERNIVGKKSQETCEDGIVVTDDFVAVMTASARKTIEPLLVQAMLDGQNKSYAVIDGFPIYREGVKAVPCLFSGANDVDSENLEMSMKSFWQAMAIKALMIERMFVF